MIFLFCYFHPFYSTSFLLFPLFLQALDGCYIHSFYKLLIVAISTFTFIDRLKKMEKSAEAKESLVGQIVDSALTPGLINVGLITAMNASFIGLFLCLLLLFLMTFNLHGIPFANNGVGGNERGSFGLVGDYSSVFHNDTMVFKRIEKRKNVVRGE